MANLIRSRVRGWCASYRLWGETLAALCAVVVITAVTAEEEL